ncbi:hypothetical protein AMTR_s00025p00201050 [Amborella trichopoda]|uniref:Uncharacterized protein n=2 Tax=Amborella trichopoda TaxID=13333 RepID=W1PXF4_AMBTC|nr:hypothetical protein AMTR_s00025p00201050 [Amborella trichopoda]
MASQIATASGPCGNNRDYLFMLEKALFDIGHEEDMVIELAREVRKVVGKMTKGIPIPLATGTHLPINPQFTHIHHHLPIPESPKILILDS